MERWGTGTVLGLAPDAASDKAARKLWSSGGWAGEGCQEQAVWGECAGSGKNPYVVQVDLSGPAYKCSCPSRKFPCKHALALLLRWADGTITEGAVPDTVAEWVRARGARAEKSAERAATRTTREPSEQSAARRRERVASGIAELSRWLEDVVGTGLGTLRSQGPAPFDRMAARLVDAQAPALAGWVRSLAALMVTSPQWTDDLTVELGLLHLLTRAHERLDELDVTDPALAASVREHVGYPLGKEAVAAQGTPVADEWSVHAVVDEPQDHLVRRTAYLQGRDSGRNALVLSFGPDSSMLDSRLPVGTRVDADLVFYPGAVPRRALLTERRGAQWGVHPPRATCLAQAVDARAGRLTRDPWVWSTQHWVRGVLVHRDGWMLADPGNGGTLPLAAPAGVEQGQDLLWTALAAGGGAAHLHLLDWSRTGARVVAWHPDGEVPR